MKRYKLISDNAAVNTTVTYMRNYIAIFSLIIFSHLNLLSQVSDGHYIESYIGEYLATEKINDTLLIHAHGKSIFLTNESGALKKAVEILGFDLPFYPRDIVLMNNNRIFIGGIYGSKGIIIEVDTALSLKKIVSINYPYLGYSGIESLEQINDSLLVAQNSRSLMALDTNFTICKYYSFADNPIRYKSLAVSSDYMAYLGGNTEFPYRMVFTKFNLKTKYAEFHKYFNRIGVHSDFIEPRQLLYFNDSIYTLETQGTISVFDTTGNVIRRIVLQQHLNNIFFENDSTFIGCGDYSADYMVTSNIIIAKYNIGGNSIWQNEFGFCNNETSYSVFKMNNGYSIGANTSGEYDALNGFYLKHVSTNSDAVCFIDSIGSHSNSIASILEDSIVELTSVFSNVTVDDFPATLIPDTINFYAVCSYSYLDSCDIPFPQIHETSNSNFTFLYHNEAKIIEITIEDNWILNHRNIYSIIDINGRSSFSGTLTEEITRIFVGDMQKGLYVITIKSDNLPPAQFKFAVY